LAKTSWEAVPQLWAGSRDRETSVPKVAVGLPDDIKTSSLQNN